MRLQSPPSFWQLRVETENSYLLRLVTEKHTFTTVLEKRLPETLAVFGKGRKSTSAEPTEPPSQGEGEWGKGAQMRPASAVCG